MLKGGPWTNGSRQTLILKSCLHDNIPLIVLVPTWIWILERWGKNIKLVFSRMNNEDQDINKISIRKYKQTITLS